MGEKSNVTDAIQRLSRNMTRKTAQSPYGGRGEGKTMRFIEANEGICVNELATLLDIRMPSLSEKLDKLEIDGNIRRIRDKRDARVVRIFITPKGRDVLEVRNRERTSFKEEFTDCLSEAEKKIFCQICNRLSDNLERLRLENCAPKKSERPKGEAVMYVEDIG